jgi:aryl-alcohol dehydrogenase-like predicted oxidoreductase
MRRREFLKTAAAGLGAAWLGGRVGYATDAGMPEIPPLNRKYRASDTVSLGKTGITTSRLAMGTGTIGGGGHSHQTRLGMDDLTALLVDGYHENGLRFYDTADSYGSHPYVASALKHVPREKVTVMTKSDNRTAAGMKADLDRFRRELGTDYIDIVLMHCMLEGDWTTRYRPVMDVLSDAKEKGIIRTHGCSCHTIEALRAAAASPWVEVDLVRLNPIGSHMDADPATVISVIKEMRGQGKGIVGMKILGQGDMRHQPNEALRYAMGTEVLDAFTIGAENQGEQNDLVRRIAEA